MIADMGAEFQSCSLFDPVTYDVVGLRIEQVLRMKALPDEPMPMQFFGCFSFIISLFVDLILVAVPETCFSRHGDCLENVLGLFQIIMKTRFLRTY